MIRYLNLFLFAGMVVMNYLANALPLNNKTTGQISDAYSNLFVPAGITFSIWGIIYLLLAIYCAAQFSERLQNVSESIGWLFAISCVLNGLWIVSWHYEKLPVSLLIMLGLLVTLIFINIMIKELPFGITKAAFGIYLGWICIATIANVTALLVKFNWNGAGVSEEWWTIIMITAGTLIASLAIYKFSNPFVGLAVIWAFSGIIIRYYPVQRIIIFTALAGIIITGIITIASTVNRNL